MATFKLKNGPPCRIRLGGAGPHRFGGPPAHRGVTPPHTNTPLHLLLLLDLADPNCLVQSQNGVRYLPLYYPLKYGFGGPSVQYSVLSEEEIRILYMSDERPDPDDEQYVRVPELPSCSAEIVPLRYEEARILFFHRTYFQPSAEDSAILHELWREHPLIHVGGYTQPPVNAGDLFCRNPECEYFDRRVWVEIIASIPPVPVNGTDEFWYEYQGGDMEFFFALCVYCGTVMAFNVAS